MFRRGSSAVVFTIAMLLIGGWAASEDVGALIADAVHLRDDGQYEAAIGQLKAALKVAPNDDQVYLELSTTYGAMGDEQHCVSTAKKGLKIASQHKADLYASLGECSSADGKIGKAVRAFRDAVDTRPDDAALRFKLASALAGTGDNKGAIDQLETAIRARPTYPEPYYLMGQLLASGGRKVSAMFSFFEYFALEPNGMRSSSACKEVFNLLVQLQANDATSASDLVVAVRAQLASPAPELQGDFASQHLLALPQDMLREKVLEPFAYILAARSGATNAADWLEKNPQRFRELNRFLAELAAPAGS